MTSQVLYHQLEVHTPDAEGLGNEDLVYLVSDELLVSQPTYTEAVIQLPDVYLV